MGSWSDGVVVRLAQVLAGVVGTRAYGTCWAGELFANTPSD